MTLSPKVRVAVEIFVNEGVERKEAAARAGLTDKVLYRAFRNPEVLAFYNEMLEALRTSQKPRNLHAAIKLRDKGVEPVATAADGRNALDAAKWLHADPDDRHGMNVNISITPGYAVDLSDWKRDKVIEHQRISVTHETVDGHPADAWDE